MMEARSLMPWVVAGTVFGGVLYFFVAKAQAEENVEPEPGPTPGPSNVPVTVKKKNGGPGDAPTGQVDVSVLELQKIMLGLGWPTEKLSPDGDYGPKTTKAWAWVTNNKNLPTYISRVDGKTARVNTHAYVSLRSQWGNRAVSNMKPEARAEYLFPIS